MKNGAAKMESSKEVAQKIKRAKYNLNEVRRKCIIKIETEISGIKSRKITEKNQ